MLYSREKVTWGKWHCPHPDCEDEPALHDPETVFRTCCGKYHSVTLIWSDKDVTPKLEEPADYVERVGREKVKRASKKAKGGNG